MNAPAPRLLPTPAATRLAALHHWPRAVLEELEAAPSVVRVLVARLRGSAPREAGACMLVTHDGIRGTIGGGRLEHEAVAAARQLLPLSAVPARVQRHVLGIELGQCCGGVVELWMERYAQADRTLLETLGRGRRTLVAHLQAGGFARELRPSDWIEHATPMLAEQGSAAGIGEAHPRRSDARVHLVRSGSGATLFERTDDDRAPLWLFGAGHVGQALVRVLADLPLRITWIDSRAELFPPTLTDGVHILTPTVPASAVAAAPPGARYLVMTHDHALDYALCRAILDRNDAAYVGLIGSNSKGARFRSRLARDGLSPERIARLVCPIGVDGIGSKWPAAIAVGVAAQLLQSLSEPRSRAVHATATPTCSGDCAACPPPQ